MTGYKAFFTCSDAAALDGLKRFCGPFVETSSERSMVLAFCSQYVVVSFCTAVTNPSFSFYLLSDDRAALPPEKQFVFTEPLTWVMVFRSRCPNAESLLHPVSFMVANASRQLCLGWNPGTFSVLLAAENATHERHAEFFLGAHEEELNTRFFRYLAPPIYPPDRCTLSTRLFIPRQDVNRLGLSLQAESQRHLYLSVDAEGQLCCGAGVLGVLDAPTWPRVHAPESVFSFLFATLALLADPAEIGVDVKLQRRRSESVVVFSSRVGNAGLFTAPTRVIDDAEILDVDDVD